MKNPANKSNVKRMAWIVKWMDDKGETYTEPFFQIHRRRICKKCKRWKN